MKKIIFKIFMISLFTSICFFGIDRVYAETTGLFVNYNDSVMNVGFTWTNSSTNKKVNLDVYYSDAYSDVNDVSDMPLYIRQTYCSTSQVITDKYFVTPTNIRCYTGGYSIGRMYFVNITFNHSQVLSSVYKPDEGLANTHYQGSYNLKLGTTGEFTFYGSDVSRDLSSFPTYSADSEILDDLDSLNSLVAMIQGDALTSAYYLEKIYDLFKCEQVNLFDNLATSDTVNGVTFTVNDDKSITVNGTATKSFNFNLGTYSLSSGTYTLTGLGGSAGSNTFSITFSGLYSVYKTSRTFTINEKKSGNVFFHIESGISIDNMTFYPQLEKGNVATSYLPYGQCRSMIDTIKDSASKSAQNSEEIKKSLSDDDTSESTSKAGDFFSGFTTNTHGLTSIITAPLSTIEYLASATCNPLSLNIPFVKDKTLDLPCMRPIYKKHFKLFIDMYDTFTFGFVSYWVLVKIFALAKEMKDPDRGEVEVIDL